MYAMVMVQAFALNAFEYARCPHHKHNSRSRNHAHIFSAAQAKIQAFSSCSTQYSLPLILCSSALFNFNTIKYSPAHPGLPLLLHSVCLPFSSIQFGCMCIFSALGIAILTILSVHNLFRCFSCIILFFTPHSAIHLIQLYSICVLFLVLMLFHYALLLWFFFFFTFCLALSAFYFILIFMLSAIIPYLLPHKDIGSTRALWHLLLYSHTVVSLKYISYRYEEKL